MTNHLVKLNTEQRNRLHQHYVCVRENYKAAGEPLQMLRIDQRMREIAWSAEIALDHEEFCIAMQPEAA